MDSGIAHNLEQLSHWGVTQARLLAFQMGKPPPHPTVSCHLAKSNGNIFVTVPSCLVFWIQN